MLLFIPYYYRLKILIWILMLRNILHVHMMHLMVMHCLYNLKQHIMIMALNVILQLIMNPITYKIFDKKNE